MAGEERLPLEVWLQDIGFSQHPFRSTESESDPALEQYFIEPDCFRDILGNAREPKSAVLFAPRGGGKTANRVVVDRWCRTGNNTGGDVFSIVYTNFDNILGTSPASLTVHHHAAEIMKVALVGLLDLWLANPRLCSQTLGAPFNVRSYVDYWLKQYHARLEPARVAALVALIPELATANIGVEKFPENPTEDFYALVTLVRAMGIHALYVLVDRVDEFYPAALDPDLGAGFLAPLIGHLPLMEHAGVAFKFFLPTEMSAALMTLGILRTERLTVRQVTWSDEKLTEILSMRLGAFSDGKIPTLDAVSVPELRGEIDRALVQAARGSPRNLVLLGATLFDVHSGSLGNNGLLITQADLESAIAQFKTRMKEERFSKPHAVGFDTRPPAARRPARHGD